MNSGKSKLGSVINNFTVKNGNSVYRPITEFIKFNLFCDLNSNHWITGK